MFEFCTEVDQESEFDSYYSIQFLLFSMLFQLHLKTGVHEKNTHLLIAEHESSLKEMESVKVSRLLVKAYLLRVQEVIDDVRLCLETRKIDSVSSYSEMVFSGTCRCYGCLRSYH